MFPKSILTTAVLAAMLVMGGCGGGTGTESVTMPTPPPAPAMVLSDTVALTADNLLISFNRAAPQVLTSTSPAISGLVPSETLLGIDYRPSNGLLYGLGSKGNVYQLDPLTGVASNPVVLTNSATGNAPIVLQGVTFGVDFNPQADRLRVVSNTGQNLRINLGLSIGNTIVDTRLPPAAMVSGSAYTNSFAGVVNTRLLSINTVAGTLEEQGTLSPGTGLTQPNDGTQTVIAPLGVLPTGDSGFDIDPRNNLGYAAFTVAGKTGLYSINLAPAAGANAATLVNDISTGAKAIKGIALASVAAPKIVGLTSTNQLVTFASNAPNTLLSTVSITGLNGPATGPAEQILGMDFRPQDGLLWALSNAGRLYTIVPATGVATFKTIISDAAALTAVAAAPTLSVDFNPVANRLRVITPGGVNLRIAVVDIPAAGTAAAVTAGTTVTDGAINRSSAAARVIAAAYTNSFTGAVATQLFDLDETADTLALQNPPNNGTVVNQGTAGLGVNITGFAGFDIAGGGNGLILAAVRAGDSGPFLLRTLNLTSGAVGVYNPVSTGTAPTDAQSQIGGAAGPVLRDIAITPL